MALVKIKFTKTGEIKEVSDHLAYNVGLQKVQQFVPIDDNGVEVTTSETIVEEKKKSEHVEVAEVEIIEPTKPLSEPLAKVEIVNPLDEETEGETTEVVVEKKKRGRKPKA
jgi:hypothetical protein